MWKVKVDDAGGGVDGGKVKVVGSSRGPAVRARQARLLPNKFLAHFPTSEKSATWHDARKKCRLGNFFGYGFIGKLLATGREDEARFGPGAFREDPKWRNSASTGLSAHDNGEAVEMTERSTVSSRSCYGCWVRRGYVFRVKTFGGFSWCWQWSGRWREGGAKGTRPVQSPAGDTEEQVLEARWRRRRRHGQKVGIEESNGQGEMAAAFDKFFIRRTGARGDHSMHENGKAALFATSELEAITGMQGVAARSGRAQLDGT